MAEWLYEAGIGENRAALIDEGRILEARIELLATLRVGSVRRGRLAAILIPARRGIVAFADGEALLEPLPPKLTEGQGVTIEIIRETVAEPGRAKLAKCRLAEADAWEKDGPTLREWLGRSQFPVTEARPSEPDRLELAGWSELLEEAMTGDISFEGGALRMSLTPAMTVFDVDGALPAAELAIAGAAAAAHAIRRLDIGGSIGIDLPTLPARKDRQAAATTLDAVLPPPFERTSVNGFGFLQVVRRRERPSIPEELQLDPVSAAARALLRRAERTSGAGTRTIVTALEVVCRLERHPDWLGELQRRLGASVALRAAPGLAISAGHVQPEHP